VVAIARDHYAAWRTAGFVEGFCKISMLPRTFFPPPETGMGLLRLLLALSVVLVHMPEAPTTLVGGKPAVQTFFMLSGFYMALVITQKYPTLGPFYFNRALRIFPTYLLVLSLSVVLDGGAKFIDIVRSSWDLPSKALMIVANIGIIGSDIMMFTAPVDGHITFVKSFWDYTPMFWHFHYIPQAWTLPLELCFYALAPFIVRRVSLLFVICGASLVLRIWLHSQGFNRDPWTYRFFPSEMLFFCGGAIAYHVSGTNRFRALYNITRGWVARIGVVSLIFLFPVVLRAGYNPKVTQVVFYCLVWLMLPFLFASTKQVRADRLFGELSYPLYVCHYLVIDAAQRLSLISGAGYISIVLGCLALAALIHLTFEIHLEHSFKWPAVQFKRWDERGKQT
jgi:peptidoglycan/LPS O-acetylase OafA/YrhL